MEQSIADGNSSAGAVTQIKYGTPYAECCPTFVKHTLPLLKSAGGPDEVRIVFWF
ncbi:MAG: hypothetical protein AB7O26_04470 [Planctomycetaceae bacterium]